MAPSREASLQQIESATLEARGSPVPLGVGPVRNMLSVGADTMVLRSGTSLTPNELTWFDRSGKSLGVVGEVGDHYIPRLSPDGNRLAVESHGGEGGVDIFVYDFKAGTRTRLTFEPTHHNAGPTWSPDGSRLTFHSTRQGVSLFIKPVSGASPEQLLFQSDGASPVGWSPNGEYLLFDWLSAPSPGIYRVAPSGAVKPEPVLVDPKMRVIQGQLSPDGTLLAYVSEERPGGEVLFQSSIKPRSSDWFHYDVAPDRNRFILVSQRETAVEPLHVIVNWRSLIANR